jgi:LPXTG-motif cell wall-anchored protein
MRATRRLAAPLVALIVAAAPATAVAQNAGDEQYADPFGNNSQSGGGGGSSNSGSSGSSQNSGTTGSGVAGTQAQLQATPSAGAAPAASSQAAGSSGQLPRTGLDVGIVAALGAALLLGGLALRRRSADARR